MVKVLQVKGILHLLLLAITMKYVHGARVLTDDVTLPPPQTIATNPIPIPVANVGPAVIPSNPISPLAAATNASVHHTLSFFMHDIFGGSAPSIRVVAGIVANTRVNGIPFSKPNGGVFLKSRGVPLITANRGIINSNFPFLSGLNGATASTVINNNGHNNLITNGKAFPFVTAGQLPQGADLQKLLFGTITVIDDELTEGHELGSSIIGKAQGFYLASSMDGSSHTMAFTAMIHDDGGHDEEDAISFFGVHRTAALESPIAIVGGTGKYGNAQGYAIIETLHHTNQHTTDGIDTLLQFTVYLTH
ncbi:dirigent protein 9-like [Durio zibethinus]|uniref:Dirigent protein n=1 Tax=Durio zibethinus TaxID=66656 RepID=A0A6P5ZVR3_DURZI|nr:dirigent protein 9-like [Durio zibethinus]